MGTLPARSPLPVSPVGHLAGRWTVTDDGLASRTARSRGTGPYEATLPAKLAGSEFTLPGELAADVADAETALAAFDAHAAARPGADNPALSPMGAVLLRTESASSSQIEDLTVGARQLALAELDESRSRNARAVIANVRTMEAAPRLAAELDLDAILAMHAELLTGAEDAGRLRGQLVWVGRSGLSPLGAVHVAPEAEDVPASLRDLVAFLARDDLPVLVHAAISHAQFETIHRFTDGNGRTGRALVTHCSAARGS